MKHQLIIAHKLDEINTPTETRNRGEQKTLQSPKLGATTTWRGRREASLSSKTQQHNPSQNRKKENRELLSNGEATDSRLIKKRRLFGAVGR
jgi:hypothetical protein